MSDLRALLRRYERAQGSADTAGLELAQAIRERIGTGGRGEASACARELGWDRRRLADWMKRAGRSEPALTGTEAARPTGRKASTGGEMEHLRSIGGLMWGIVKELKLLAKETGAWAWDSWQRADLVEVGVFGCTLVLLVIACFVVVRVWNL